MKCCISSAVDQADTLYNGSAEDGNVWSECEEDEGTAVERDSDTDW